jgi:hypothetical protein
MKSVYISTYILYEHILYISAYITYKYINIDDIYLKVYKYIYKGI